MLYFSLLIDVTIDVVTSHLLQANLMSSPLPRTVLITAGEEVKNWF